jgi:hypothetical protein
MHKANARVGGKYVSSSLFRPSIYHRQAGTFNKRKGIDAEQGIT